ncbi:LuxR family two component transcriptional regulator [Desulfitobacterium sp. LBE]|uniref:Stage 0 sporulation protein A homolog n=1 Tax=Desulfitobacterium hafniense TaxID=49338 RepID=A0A098B3B4_DESHA|nr:MULTISPECIES: response regulator transcription factor [Desulfitobacterium]TWH60772.1 LuxR family two component transcriptional regulator [Desulfitobacterium sp. LBE]CDX02361.1 Two component transcriptional regulator, LuxR [Desulfitobacterium hafniense]
MIDARIIVVDEKRLFREGLCRMLYQLSWVSSVVGYNTVEEGIKAIHQYEANLYIMNPFVGGEAQYAFVKEIRAHKPGIKIVLLTDFDDADSILDATQQHINGYFSKSMAFDKFEVYLHEVMEGKYRLSEALGSLLFERLVKKNSADDLTAREKVIYQMMRKGYTNKEIAKQLSISTNTARNHVSSIMHKLNISSRYRIPESQED